LKILNCQFRYNEEHPGLFPKITTVHRAIGGSYNILKGIFSKFEETFLQHSADPTPQQEEAFTKPCPKEKLNELVNEISSASEQTEQCEQTEISSASEQTEQCEQTEISSASEQTEQCGEVSYGTISINSTTNIEWLTESSLVPPVDEKHPNVHADSLKIEDVMADRKNIFELNTKERDFKQRKYLSGSKTRCTDNLDAQRSEELRGVCNTNSMYNIIKGLQNGPKSTVKTTSAGSKESAVGLGTGSTEWLGSAKEALLEQRDLNGTKGCSVLEKDSKKFILSDIFKLMKSNPETGVDVTAKTNDTIKHKTLSREDNGTRYGDDYDQIGNIFSQIITRTEKQTCMNTGSWAHTLPKKKSPGLIYGKAINIPGDKTKYVGGIMDVLNKQVKEVTENEDSDSDIAACEYLDFQPAVVAPTPIPKERSKYGLFVSFLDKVTSVSDVYNAFDGCGPLHEVHFTISRKLDRYKCANVFFKVGPYPCTINVHCVSCSSVVVLVIT
jgi:hypothetical protein